MDTDYNLQELYERVGRNIAYLRKCKKLTQEEFAYHLNIHSQALVSQYEYAKKSLTLERIIEFCSFFEVPLEDMLFRDFLYIEQIKLSNNEVKTTTPIQKCAGNTYYGYYLKEQNKGCSEFSSQIACFEMDVLHSTLSHEAPVKLFLSNDRNSGGVNGTLHMDESYAYVICHDLEKDSFWGLTFFYHRQRKRKKYIGGMALLQTLDYHILPISQFCILSTNAISSKHNLELKNYCK